MAPNPDPLTPSGQHRILTDPTCAHDGGVVCPPPGSRVAERSWVYERIAIVGVVLVGVFTFIGGVTYAQSHDAGVAAAEQAQAKAVKAEADAARVAAALAEFKVEETAARRILEAKVGFVDQKIDLLLINSKIPLPSPPPVLRDAGL